MDHATTDHTHDSHAHDGGGHGGGHGHGHGDGPDHHPHVVPLKSYFGVWIALLILTAITVGVSYIDFGDGNLIIALVVATIKASLVAAIFMHLAYDNKFNAIVLCSSVIFLTIFISFTSFDTFGRGQGDRTSFDRTSMISAPFDPNAAVPGVLAAEKGDKEFHKPDGQVRNHEAEPSTPKGPGEKLEPGFKESPAQLASPPVTGSPEAKPAGPHEPGGTPAPATAVNPGGVTVPPTAPPTTATPASPNAAPAGGTAPTTPATGAPGTQPPHAAPNAPAPGAPTTTVPAPARKAAPPVKAPAAPAAPAPAAH